ncbi:MAG: hypothetical protein OEY09_15905 [Gammaproteobacteria bacterium]|nr:hypothetical protein [Gammaproteobacteria bacterium]
MTQFNETKIKGIDANRPPRIRKEAYIDLFYQLSEDAPEEWCEDFSNFGRRINPLAKIEKGSRCFIGTYVNDMDSIPAHFKQIKQAVMDCNTQYLEKIRQRELVLVKDNAASQEQGGLQFKLNQIIASLDFES